MIEPTLLSEYGTFGFASVVVMYLLYERSKFNEKIVKQLEHISTTLLLLVNKLQKEK